MEAGVVVIFLPVGILVLAAIFDAFHNHLSRRRDFVWLLSFSFGGVLAFAVLFTSNILVLEFMTHSAKHLQIAYYLSVIVPVGFILGAITGTMYALQRKALFRVTWRLGLICGLPWMLIFLISSIFGTLRMRSVQYMNPPTTEQRFADAAVVALLYGIPAIWSGLLVWWALNSRRAVSRSAAAASSQPDAST